MIEVRYAEYGKDKFVVSAILGERTLVLGKVGRYDGLGWSPRPENEPSRRFGGQDRGRYRRSRMKATVWLLGYAGLAMQTAEAILTGKTLNSDQLQCLDRFERERFS